MKKESILKILSMTGGALLFGVILPALGILYLPPLMQWITIPWPRLLEILIALLCIPLGLFFMVWTTFVQVKIGLGTPVQFLPTQRLVIEGPYKLCRNPIQLGAILYYLGIVTLFSGLTVGMAFAFLVLILASLFHKYVEERGLEKRFGSEYEKYRKKTPFLIPRFWKIRN